MRSPGGPSLGRGWEWGEVSWAHELLAVAWPQSPLEPKGWGMGVEDTKVPASLSPDPWWVAVWGSSSGEKAWAGRG